MVRSPFVAQGNCCSSRKLPIQELPHRISTALVKTGSPCRWVSSFRRNHGNYNIIYPLRASDYIPVMEEFRFLVQHPPGPEPFNAVSLTWWWWWRAGAGGRHTNFSFRQIVSGVVTLGGGAFVLCFAREIRKPRCVPHRLNPPSGGHSHTEWLFVCHHQDQATSWVDIVVGALTQKLMGFKRR